MRNTKKDIAIIGMSGKFPGSQTLDEFWSDLVNGKESVQVKKSPQNSEEGFIQASSRIEGAEFFDNEFFNYSEVEASSMDPQIRLAHEQVYLALESSGINPYSHTGRMGVFLAARDNFNWRTHDYLNQEAMVNEFLKDKIAKVSSISTLISYHFDFTGPSVFVDTACSSSLTALHFACRSLLNRDCNKAIAGGVTIDSEFSEGYQYSEGLVHSTDGHCRAFDKDSSGTVGGEGAGIVILKRLEDAKKDNDNILAVIRATAINNDGKRKVGFTAPSVDGQAECIKLAHRIAGIHYSEVNYLETHGTGTSLGDSVEIEALNKAFENDLSISCPIGSLKSNIGHLDGTAGIANVIKTVLSLQNQLIPASINFNEPNPNIPFENGPFFVNNKLSTWETDHSRKRLAGVSSFGIGGTNSHCIIEEYTGENLSEDVSNEPDGFKIALFTAKSKSSLSNYLNNFDEYLQGTSDGLSNIIDSLNSKKFNYNFRCFSVASNLNELSEGLKNKKIFESSIRKNSNPVFMFSGSGTQYKGMGKDLYYSEPVFRKFMDRGFDQLKIIFKYDFKKLLYDGEEKLDINNILYSQPLVFIYQYAISELLFSKGIHASKLIGHSLGEIAAACISGVFNFEDALDFVIYRAQLLEGCNSGVMLAVNANVSLLNGMLDERYSIASVNSPENFVISGPEKDVTTLQHKLTKKNINSSFIRASIAGHSPILNPLKNKLYEFLAEKNLNSPKIPIVANISSTDLPEINTANYWGTHLTETVYFQNGIESILNTLDNSVLIEIGPGNTLTTFVNQIIADKESCRTVSLSRHPKEEIDDQKKMYEGLGSMWAYGCNVDFDSKEHSQVKKNVKIPGYYFDKNSFPVRVDVFEEIKTKYRFEEENSLSFYFPEKRKSIIWKESNLTNDSGAVLLFKNDSLDTDKLLELIGNNYTILSVEIGKDFSVSGNQIQVNISEKNWQEKLFSYLENNLSVELTHIIYTWPIVTRSLQKIYKSLTGFVGLLDKIGNHAPDKFKKFIYTGHFHDEHRDVFFPLLNVFEQEYINVMGCAMEISESKEDKWNNYIVKDILGDGKSKIISYDKNLRFEHYLSKTTEFDSLHPTNLLHQFKGKLFLITGGMGKVSSILANYLHAQYGIKIVSLGRSNLPSDLQSVPPSFEDFQKIFIKKCLDNTEVNYYETDISIKSEVRSTLNMIRENHGRISGVIHCAAEKIDAHDTLMPLSDLNEEILEKQFLPKVVGLQYIYEILKPDLPDLIWATSSNSAWIGGSGYGAYASANKYLDSLIRHFDNGMSVNLEGLGNEYVDFHEIPNIFEKSLNFLPYSNVILSNRNVNKLLNYNSRNILEPSALESGQTGQKISNSEALNEIEAEIMKLIAPFFPKSEIGIKDNFFELGGDSLKALTIGRLIHQKFNIDLKPKDFFSNPTLEEICSEITFKLKLQELNKKEDDGDSQEIII